MAEKLEGVMYAVVAKKGENPWGLLTSYNAFFLGEETARHLTKKTAAGWSAVLYDHDVRACRIVPTKHSDPKMNAGQFCDYAINSGKHEFI